VQVPGTGKQRMKAPANNPPTLNARIGAISLVTGALLTLVLSHTEVSLAPLRICAVAIALFAIWAFVDEMGVRKPLNRAGFVCFSIAAFCKIQISLGVDQSVLARYMLLYSAFLLIAVLLWSIAFLHRNRELKIVGAVGMIATVTPLALLLVGHIAVGFGAVSGIGALLLFLEDSSGNGTDLLVTVDRLFGLWCSAVVDKVGCYSGAVALVRMTYPSVKFTDGL